MNLDQLSNVPDGEPFVKTHKLTIYTLRSDDGTKIIGFHTVLDGKEKVFKVDPKKNNIQETWMEMEKYTGKVL